MKIGMLVDGRQPSELAHARDQATRLRRCGFAVFGPGMERGAMRNSFELVYAVGPGCWHRGRRLARRSGLPVVYDHPPGAPLPRRLQRADAVVAAGYLDGTALARRLGDMGRVVVALPDFQLRPGGIRPRLRRRLGIGGDTLLLQEAAGLSLELGEAAIDAISSMAAVHLVFLGGAQWSLREALAKVAGEAGASDRVHFAGKVPATRRAAYLGEADIGLDLGDQAEPDRVPAGDVFEALGMPYIALPRELDPEPPNRVIAAGETASLRAAIAGASERPRMPARIDRIESLKAIIRDVASDGGPVEAAFDRGSSRSEPVAQRRRLSEPPPASPPSGGSASSLLAQAKLRREEGEVQGALDLYMQVAGGPHPSEAIATAAAALARLDARAEARAAIERVLSDLGRPVLATVRIGEAAALLGDLIEARERVDQVLADPSASELALRGAVRVLEQAGEPRAALRLARQIAEPASIARIEGTLAAYDPTWLPAKGGRAAPPRGHTGRAFTLLETSLPYARSGYTYRTQTLLRAQRDAGIEPVALTRLGFPATRGFDAPPSEEVDRVVHHRTSLPGLRRSTGMPVSEQLEENVRWAANLARDMGPAGIFATTPHFNGLIGLGLRKMLGVPVAYDVRGFPEMTWAVRKGGRDTDIFGLRRVAETRCMREADLVTTLSETMRQHIVGRGIPEENVFVLPHAVDTTAFAPIEGDRDLAERLGIAGRPVIGYISSLVGYEGVDTLLDAIALVRQHHPQVAGLIVGSGQLLPTLEGQTKRLGLDENVIFTGRVEASEIMRYYSLIDVFVCPRQDHEVTRVVTPLKPFEAMAAGSCLVVSDLPALREAVCNGQCGALFPAGDAEALAATVVELLDRPERRSALEEAARKHAVANHGFDTLSARLEKVWVELGVRFDQAASMRYVAGMIGTS